MNIRVQRDVTFGQARIGYNQGRGPMQDIALKLDAYLPAVPASGSGARPRRCLPSRIEGKRRLLRRHRRQHGHRRILSPLRGAGLARILRAVSARPDGSEPSRAPVLTEPDQVPMSRVSALRAEMGQPPLEPREMARVMEAAFDDVTEAIRFVKANAGNYGVDAGRVLVGGFSAGARAARYAAYGKRVGVAGVFSISAPLVPVDAKAYLTRRDHLPPLLMISGERDLDYVCTFVPDIEQQFRAAGQQVEWAQVPGATRFYSAESRIRDGRTVFEVIGDSVNSWVGWR
jgi:predicted esterase